MLVYLCLCVIPIPKLSFVQLLLVRHLLVCCIKPLMCVMQQTFVLWCLCEMHHTAETIMSFLRTNYRSEYLRTHKEKHF